MKQLIETVYPLHDGETPLLTMRDGAIVGAFTPRTPAEAGALHRAMVHATTGGEASAEDLASPPRTRRAWLTDQGRSLMTEEKGAFNVLVYRLDHAEAKELLLALDQALSLQVAPKPDPRNWRGGGDWEGRAVAV